MELRMRQLFALVIVLLLAVASCAFAQAQTDEPAQTPQAGDEWTEPITGMEFVWVPGGCYEMGCGEWAGDCREDELPVHEVCVDGFWMGKYEVTEGQWNAVMGDIPINELRNRRDPDMGSVAGFDDHGDNYPIINISWDDAQWFISRLAARSEGDIQFRLPTEAEWEFACRSGGREEIYAGGEDINALAWYGFWGNYGQHQPVGGKAPNGLGLYDMSGNVWEWVQDSYNDSAYTSLPQDNPMYSSDDTMQRVARGGAWNGPAWGSRCSIRGNICMPCRSYSTGIRIIAIPN